MTSITFRVSEKNQEDCKIRGICTATIMFSRMKGSAVGTAIIGAVLNLSLQWRLPQVQDPVQQIMSEPSRQQLQPENLQQMVAAIAASLHWVFVVALVIALFAVGVAWMMPRQRPEQAE